MEIKLNLMEVGLKMTWNLIYFWCTKANLQAKLFLSLLKKMTKKKTKQKKEKKNEVWNRSFFHDWNRKWKSNRMGSAEIIILFDHEIQMIKISPKHVCWDHNNRQNLY